MWDIIGEILSGISYSLMIGDDDTTSVRPSERQPIIVGDAVVTYSKHNTDCFHVHGVDKHQMMIDLEVNGPAPKVKTIKGIDVVVVYKSSGGNYYSQKGRS